MTLNHIFLKWIFMGGGAVWIVLLSIPAWATSLLPQRPESSTLKTVEIETAEFDTALDLEVVETPELSVDWVEISKILVAESVRPTATQMLQLSFAEGLRWENSSESWVSTADSLLPLDHRLAFQNTEIPIDHSEPVLSQVRPANEGDGWEFVLEPYIFVPFNVTTDVTVGGVTQSISSGLGDIVSLDRIFSGALRFEARNPQYGFFADLSHVFVREGRSIAGLPLPPAIAAAVNQRTPPGIVIPPGTPVDVDVRATGRTTTFDLGGYYRVVDQYLGRTATNQPTYPRLLFDPYLGLRIARLSGDLNFRVGLGPLALEDVPVTESATLIKPLLGAQLGLELSDRWALGLRGSVSGLGFGADENLAWGLLAGARYRLSQRAALQLAYQYKESRYSAGQGIGRFSLNQVQQGMWLGVDIGL